MTNEYVDRGPGKIEGTVRVNQGSCVDCRP
jgi:hypothetical protein